MRIQKTSNRLAETLLIAVVAIVAFLIGLKGGKSMNSDDNADAFTAWKSPFVHSDEVEIEYASHGDKIQKRVLVRRGEIPHLNQIARISLKPGQVATENHHLDMSEVFYIISGTGIFTYDGKQHPIKAGSTIRAMPPHRHEVINRNESAEDLVMLVVAVAHDCPAISQQKSAPYQQ